MFTVDASVHLNALNPSEKGSKQSQSFLGRLHRRPWPVSSPTLLLVEIAGALARVRKETERAIEMSRMVRSLPGQVWIPLDDALAEICAELAARHGLRGADAVYAGVARRERCMLVTRDTEQLERLPPVVRTVTPEQALEQIAALEAADRAS